MNYELEKLFRIYDLTEQIGKAIEVKPDPDFSDTHILISTEDRDAEEYYGKVKLMLPKEQAKLLAQAILELTGE